MAHQVFARQIEKFWIFPFGLRAPLLETGAVDDIGAHDAIVESKDHLVVHQHIAAAGLVLQRFDLLYQPAVVIEEGRARIELPRNQCVTDENFSCLLGIDRSVVNPPPRHQRQSVKRHALVRRYHGTLALPVRVKVVLFYDISGGCLDPLGLDPRDRARKKPRRFHELGSNYPARLLLSKARAGKYRKAHAARSKVLAGFLAL